MQCVMRAKICENRLMRLCDVSVGGSRMERGRAALCTALIKMPPRVPVGVAQAHQLRPELELPCLEEPLWSRLCEPEATSSSSSSSSSSPCSV